MAEIGEKRSGARLWLFTALFFVLAVALGYYAWQLHKRQGATADALRLSSEAQQTCAGNLTKEKLRSADLDGKLTGCGSERDTAKAGGAAAAKVSAELADNLKASRAELDELRKQRAQADARLAAFADLTEKFKKMVDSGKINVVVREGRMTMKLPAGILFASGSAELSKDGQMALMEVAVILKGLPDRHFMVAGHTDDVPPGKSSKYRSNWELSTARAVTVTEFLIGAGMKPRNLVAAGYGEFDPVSRSNKAENRRIEIVLLPNLEELPKLPDSAAPEPDKK